MADIVIAGLTPVTIDLCNRVIVPSITVRDRNAFGRVALRIGY
jgi:hypothetical protein